MSQEIPQRLSRNLQFALGSLGCVACTTAVIGSLILRSVPGLARAERLQGVAWHASDHPVQYWTALLLLGVGAVVFGKSAWSAYRE